MMLQMPIDAILLQTWLKGDSPTRLVVIIRCCDSTHNPQFHLIYCCSHTMPRSRVIQQVHRDNSTLQKKRAWLKQKIKELRDYAWNHEGKDANGWLNLKRLSYNLNNKYRRNFRNDNRGKELMPTGKGRPRKQLIKGSKWGLKGAKRAALKQKKG